MADTTTTATVTPPTGTVVLPGDAVPGPPAGAPATPPAVEVPATDTVDPEEALSLEDPDLPPEDAAPQEYMPTGDAGLDIALQFVGGLGFGADHPSIAAAKQGDFGPLRKNLQALGARASGFEPYIKVAEDYASRHFANTKAESQKTVDAVVSAVGGKDQWAAIQKWAAENADPHEKVQINAAFKAGPLAAAAMAEKLSTAFKQAGNPTAKTPSAIRDDAGGSTGTAGYAIGPAEYKAEIKKLTAKYGWGVAQTPEYAQLQTRRKAYQG